MIDNGYLFARDSSRLFINTTLGCNGGCSYCYLPKVGYDNNNLSNNFMSASSIIEFLEHNAYITDINTLITLGCFSECWNEKNKKETIELIKYFLNKGNQVQMSTKKRVEYNDLIDIIPFIQYYGQFVIFVSSSTITKHSLIEKNTDIPSIRFESFNLIKYIPVVLYLKPILKNITIADLDLYEKYIKDYKIRDVVVGSIFTSKVSEETVPFSNKNNLFYNTNFDETIIIDKLGNITKVFTRSTDVMSYYKQQLLLKCKISSLD